MKKKSKTKKQRPNQKWKKKNKRCADGNPKMNCRYDANTGILFK